MSACDHNGPSKVLQTRHFEGQIYRERLCEHCGQRIFTEETQIPKMPKGMQKGRRRSKAAKRLTDAWSGQEQATA